MYLPESSDVAFDVAGHLVVCTSTRLLLDTMTQINANKP